MPRGTLGAPGLPLADPQDPFVFAHQHREEVVWMSQNTNHLPTTPVIEAAILEAVHNREYSYYPYGKGLFGLPERVLAELKAPPSEGWQCAITAGALEGLYAVMRGLLKPGDEVLASDPSFLPIHHQIQLSGAVPVEIPIYEEPWKLTVEKARAAITPRTRMLLLIDPINPLGTQYSRDEVRAFAALCREKDLWLVHDLTYRDFAFDPALAGEFAPERTIYAYSFSKNAGLAGFRVGAIAAKKDVMDKISPAIPGKLGTDSIAQRAALAAMETKVEWIDEVVNTAREHQRVIHDVVRKIDGLFVPVFPSSTNTLIIDLSARGLDPSEVERRLLYDHKVFIRGGPYLSKRFGARFVRVSFTVPRAGIDRFCAAFPDVVERLSAKR